MKMSSQGPDGRPIVDDGRTEMCARACPGTLLVAEDDEALLECVSEALGAEGYRVISATSVEEAMNKLTAEQSVDLVVADVIMPVRGGPPLVERMRALRPDVPILFMSGYRAEELTRQGLLGQGDCFLRKPFTSEDIVAHVDRILVGRQSAECP